VAKAAQTNRDISDGMHEGFLRHRNFRWLKIASLFSISAVLSYVLVDVQPRHNGGSWYGYTLGTIGVLLILWLAALGIRKRAMTRGRWSLKAWTSAHVYLGLSLIFIGTLHGGLQFGWNVHTLAYALMILVIVSGIWGISVYAALPRAMSANRDQMTEVQMLAALRSVDRQLHDAAQPLSQDVAALVKSSLQDNAFGGGVFKRLSGRYQRCKTRRALNSARGEAALDQIEALLERKLAILSRIRRHLRLKAYLEIWLYVHVPATFALIAALTAHVISVFFYW
jgi:hypothetical protein